MAKCFLITVLGVYVIFTHVKSEIPKQYAMSDRCGSTIPFSDSMVLSAANMTSASCNVVIQSYDVDNRLLLHFINFNLMDNCTVTQLSILDLFGRPMFGPLCGDNLNITVFKSETNVARFQYVNHATYNKGASFSTIITSFNNGIKGKCAHFEFQCANKLCISENLVCNSFDECSDDSDETLPCQDQSSHTWLIVGSTLGTVVVLGVVACVAFKIRKRKQNIYGTVDGVGDSNISKTDRTKIFQSSFRYEEIKILNNLNVVIPRYVADIPS